jgi:hypothetical protein
LGFPLRSKGKPHRLFVRAERGAQATGGFFLFWRLVSIPNLPKSSQR